MSSIEAILWDLDNTLYRFTDDFKLHCNHAAAQAAIVCGIDLPYEDCLKVAIESEKQYHFSLNKFVLDHGILYKKLHFPFHEAIETSYIKEIVGLKDKISQLPHRHLVITNASRHWATRSIDFLGLSFIFDKDAILCMEEFNFEPKARGRKGFDLAIERLSINPENIILVDDLIRNLAMASTIGIKTAHIDYGLSYVGNSFKPDGRYYDANAFCDSVLLA